jgi:hypothetical protein
MCAYYWNGQQKEPTRTTMMARIMEAAMNVFCTFQATSVNTKSLILQFPVVPEILATANGSYYFVE